MEYIIHLAILFSIYAILGVSLNLVVGYTGLLSVTHAAFYGMGAYATALLSTLFGAPFLISVLIGIGVAGVFSFLMGMVLSRFRGDYYALASLGFNIIVYSIFLNWQSVTRGPLGIAGITKPEIFNVSFSSNLSFLLLAAICLVLIYGISRFIVSSSFGRVLKAIREDEKVITVFGYRTLDYKLVIFVISASMAAVAGSLFAAYISFIDPSTFTVMESIFILAIIILGGLANIKGSMVGALFLILVPELLRFIGLSSDIAGYMRQLLYGIILIVLMLYRPQGLVGEYKL
ncbi:branched-chain amino acid ABC transporter permease [Patescibacteria group bacterium AH-259-L05]|nr:branched-chain amino acid ABC transporter permease [Patescibacteria group bacterium AH-259-L05]